MGNNTKTNYGPHRAFGVQVVNLRKRKHLTQPVLGALLGVDRRTIGFYENGHLLPSNGVEIKLAKLLETSVENLFRHKNDGLWGKDEIQFARLLAEINAVVELTAADYVALSESMDLSVKEIKGIFNRAEVAFENTKSSMVGKSR